MKKFFFDNIQNIRLTESLDGGNKYHCIIIKPGSTSTANTYAMFEGRKVAVKKNYPKEILMNAAAKGFFEGVPMVLRSEQDHLSGKNQDINNIVGYFTETKWDDTLQAVTGTFNLKQSNALSSEFKNHLKKVWETTKDIGLSITGFGEWVIGKVSDGYEALVTSLENITSVDPCNVGNAGGRIIALSESKNIINYSSNQNKNNMLNAKQRTALFSFLQNAGKISADVKETDLTDDQLLEKATPKDMIEFYASIPAGDPPADPPVDPPADPPAGDPPVGSEKEKLLDKAIAEANRIAAEHKFYKILGESKLNQKAKDLIEARYKKLQFKFVEADLKKELIDQAKLLAEAGDSAFFRGLNKSMGSAFNDPKIGMEQDDKYMLGMEYLLSNAAIRSRFTAEEKKAFQEAGVTGLVSMKEFYKELTGDYAISGKEGRGKLAEAITVSSYPELLGISMHKTMIRAYKMSAYQIDWRKIVKIVPRVDFKTNTMIYKGGYGNLPTVAEGAVYTAATTPGEQKQTYAVTKKGNIETVTREALFNDDLSVFQDLPFEIGEAAARTIYEFVFNFLLTNSGLGATMGYDSVALFDAAHNNKMVSALDATSFKAGRKLMFNQVDLTNSKKLGFMPKYLLVPIELEDVAYTLTTPAAGLNNQVPAFNQTWNVEPIIMASASDANDWYLVGDPLRGVPTIEVGFLNGREEPEILLQDQPTNGNVFTNDVITYKIRQEYDGAVMNHRGFVGSIVP